MSTLRSNIDQNQLHEVSVLPIMTDTNSHEVRCAMCAKELYVDDEGYRRYIEALNAELDSPFLCEMCEDE
jgi:hypothetical protein